MEVYRNYKINLNNFYDNRYPQTKYEYYNLVDCDETMGCGESLEDCREQIDETIDLRL